MIVRNNLDDWLADRIADARLLASYMEAARAAGLPEPTRHFSEALLRLGYPWSLSVAVCDRELSLYTQAGADGPVWRRTTDVALAVEIVTKYLRGK